LPGNGTRSFETLLRYRGAAMAEFWRALRTRGAPGRGGVSLEQTAGAALALETRGSGAGARRPQTKRTRATRDFVRHVGMGCGKRA
jgi:hypothetical protein